MDATYLYGIIAGGEAARLEVSGIHGARPVRTVGADGVACLVSEYRGQEFEAMSKEDTFRNLLAHQEVIESATMQHTVLPVKFGTLLANPGEVRDLLSQGREELLEALASIQGKVEVDVAATWDRGRVLEEISREPGVVIAREAIGVRAPVRLGEMVKASMDWRRKGYRLWMGASLRPVSVTVADNALLSDETVMNGAFLVERSRQRKFDERIRALDDLFRGQITFRVIGPLPPYSFKSVEVKRITQEQAEAARERLGLPGAPSEGEVKWAYRRRASEVALSLGPGDGGAGERFKVLIQARELLLRGCRARDRARREASCLFSIAIGGPRRNGVEAARFGAS